MATSKICRIDGCGKRAHARELCGKHYYRRRIHGTTDANWTEFGAPLAHYRSVVLAHVADECLIWPFSRNKAGYAAMHVEGGIKVLVSRYLCEDRRGPPPTAEHEAAHSCGRGKHGCVAQAHLDWKTSVENKADKRLHGTDPTGERNPAAKITRKIADEIRSLRGMMSQSKIGERFGISQQHVSDIMAQRLWADPIEDCQSFLG